MFRRMCHLSMVVDGVLWVCLNRMHTELCSSQEHLPKTGSRRTWITHCLSQSGAELIASAASTASSGWCWRSWLFATHESVSSLHGRPTRVTWRGVLVGFLGGVIVSSSPDDVCSLLSPAMDDIAAVVSREWAGVVGDALCSIIWPRCVLCSLEPQMFCSEAGPSGDERMADSANQAGCTEVHNMNQVSIWDSDAPMVVQILVRRGSPLLSFCLLGFSSMWWRVSMSSLICEIVARPPIPSM
jgi:hypothetical protein